MGAFLVLDLRRHAVNMKAGMKEGVKDASGESQAGVISKPEETPTREAAQADITEDQGNGDENFQDLADEPKEGEGGQ